jgi:gliding motility-associated-like protein
VNGNAVTSGTASGPISLNVGTNTITTVVTAEDGTTTDTYTVVVTRAASASATLSNLTLSSGTLTPGFASGTTSYTASVSNATTSITVIPTTSDANATVTVNGTAVVSGTASGAISLNVGTNTITTIVTAEDGTTTDTYAVVVTRATSSVATLSNLTLSAGTLNPSFTSGTTSYTASASNATANITVTPTTTSANSTVTVNGTTVASGSASGAINLNIGPNTITVVVTAEDGTTTDTYTVVVTRAASPNATLSNLTISAGTLNPAFSSAVTSYTDNVANAIATITVSPTATDPNATITVNGISVASGGTSLPLILLVGPISLGQNIVTIIVTAQDGTTTDTYTINVGRGSSSIATLSNLTLSTGTLTPTFASGANSYTASVSNTTTSITVIPTTTDATSTVTVNGATVASGTASGPISLNVGPNTITTVVTAQDGTTTNTYTVVVTRSASSTATLSDLTLSSGALTPGFASGTTSYTASVSNATTSITVTPTASDVNTTITVNGAAITSGTASNPISLNVGPNTITTVVTAQDGTTTDTYTVVVTRGAASVATLSNLVLSSGTLTPGFASGTTSYTASVSNATTSITVTPTTTDANATVTVNGTSVTSGTASGSISLNVGANTITTVVTAQDGTTTNTYTVVVTRAASSLATLSNLTISAGTLAPAFTSGTTSYAASVSNATTSITVTPTAADANSTITVNGAAVVSGNASGPIPLSVGNNAISVVVTAQDGTTTDTYTISVSRAPSSIVTLSNITLSSGTLVPVFNSSTLSYVASVSNATTSITVTATTSDAAETVTVNGIPVISGSASGPISLNVGPNTINLLVTAQNGSTTTYSITVTRGPGADATLSNLTISSGTLIPVFVSVITNYTAIVPNATASITVTPTTNDVNATVTVNGVPVTSGTASGVIGLSVGTNTITTIVTAQDGTTTDTYTIVITRGPSSNATLSNLTPSSGILNPTFASGINVYTASVANIVSGITLTPTTTDANATVTVNGAAVASGTASGSIPLIIGPNLITIIVTAQDGVTKNTYLVTVTRAQSSTATLSNLTISSGTLTPTFASGTTAYTANVTNGTTTITITPTAADPAATVTVNGTPVASGTASGPIPLVIGPNVITAIVTAQDGVTSSIYTITIIRAASSIATLSNLTISSGTLVPVFASGTTSYTASVANTITGITVTPTTTDATATIMVNGVPVISGTASNAINLSVGANTITIIVTAQDGTTTDTYAVIVNRAPSSTASLSNLTLSAGSLTPVFSSATINYVAGESNTTTSITVTPTVTDPTATVTVNGSAVASGAASGAIPLAIGPNTVTVVVTAQDGTTKTTYTVIVTRTASSTATLSNLTISSGTLAPNFNTSVTSYAVSVPNAVSSVTVTPTATDPNAIITVNGTAATSGSPSSPIPLVVGSNIVNIVVTAQDGTTVTYTITVSRTPATSVVLANLTISSGSLAPDFLGTIFSYASAVANATTSLTVTATTSDPTNTITINGVQTGSGTPSAPISLNVGANLITVIVSAPGGVSTTYTITVARAGTSVATLSNLTLSHGTLKPAFSGTIKSYTADVDYSISSLTVTATTTNAGATIKVNGVVANNGQPSQVIDLAPGDNTITVDVLAQDGITTVTYTVVVTRNVPQNDVTANNLLTPNGDGKNDTWFIKNIDLFPNNTVTVFDHSGKVLFTRKGYSNDWDGNYNGQPLKEDTYYYVIDLGPGDRKIKGYVTVIKRR